MERSFKQAISKSNQSKRTKICEFVNGLDRNIIK
jgi:hypothetical protein